MAERLKRASLARFAVGMAALAFPLLAVGTAQAAIAGANPESTTNRPDLVSATAITGTSVDFCFDKTLNNTGFSGANFTLGGYRAGRTLAGMTGTTGAQLEQTVDTTGKCVRVTFPSSTATGVADIGQYTFGEVAANAVSTGALITNPYADTATLIVPASSSPTHNGTAGFTVGPDLTGVLPDPTTNSITYTEDQAISTGAPAPTANMFTFTRSGGTTCTGTSTLAPNGDQITVFFSLGAGCPVSDAVRAGQMAGALNFRAADDPTVPSTPDEAIVPASTTNSGGGVTALPDLTSTILETGGQAVDYTFDKNVSVVNSAGFQAVLSDGGVVTSNGASVLSANGSTTTVRVVFPNLGSIDEYLVRGAILPGAVTEVSPPNNPNSFDSAPAGDNSGAFARGFTTGTDVFGATINRTNGVVTLGLDQRAFSSTATNIYLLDATGIRVATANVGAATLPTQLAGPSLVTVQFSPGQTLTATNVEVDTGAFTTSAPVSAVNVPQILSGTVSSSLLHSARLHKASKKQVAARKAKVSRQEKALVKKLLRQRHHSHRA